VPELPEVETVRQGLRPVFEGARFLRVETRRAGLRVPFPENFAERIAGRRTQALRRRAKYLLADLDSGVTLVMHLGMSGSFRIERDAGSPSPARGEGAKGDAFYYERSKVSAHDHVVFHFDGGARVVYNDPRRFGLMTLIASRDLERHELFDGLGLEPLSEAFNVAALAQILDGVRAPLKSA
jgi:formamidopyrimidine-DNA glycosylase